MVNFIAASVLQLFSLPMWAYVLFFSILFVVFYLYFMSEIVKRKRLVIFVVIFALIFIGINLYFYFQTKTPEIQQRLVVFPLLQKQQNEESATFRVFWDVVNQQLDKQLDKKIALIKSNDLMEFVNFDSLKNRKYQLQLASQIGANVILFADINFSENDLLHCSLLRTSDEKLLFEKSLAITPETIAKHAGEITKAVQEKLGYPAIDESFQREAELNAKSYFFYLQAQELYSKQKYDEAIQAAARAVAIDSNFAPAVLLLGKANFFKGMEIKNEGKLPVEYFVRAYDAFSRAVAMDSSFAEAYAFLGEYYVYKERWSLAEANLKKALELNPRIARIYLNLSRLHPSRYRKLGFRDEKALFRRAIEINPCEKDGYLMLADYYLFQNQKDNAIRVLESYLKINPNSVPVLMALGKNYMLKRDVLKIIEVYNRVIALDPYNADAFYNLGVWYYNSEDYKNAERFFRRAIAINNHLNSHLYLAYLYEMQGEMDKAIEHLRYRIKFRKGFDDEFAEEARKHLYNLLHSNSKNTEN